MAQHSFRQGLLFTACGLALQSGAAFAADAPPQVNLGVQLAQADVPQNTGPARAGSSGKAIPPDVSRGAPETIIVKAQRRLLKDKNSPSAVTELGEQEIKQASVAGSTGTLLRQAPSIYVYQQGLGDNAPEFTIRGVRGLEVATTLDGIPTQDLLAPGSSYLANNIGGVYTLGQISGVSIYPGVASPDKNTFGTIGGTIAYDSKRPTNDYYLDLTGSVGSFGTYTEGFELNSGALDSPFGTGDNAAKVLLNYKNLQTQGFIDGTPNRENEMEFAFDKPYDDGLSKFQATVIYNTAAGLIENEPVPVPYLNKNGAFSNYPTNLDFAKQNNDFLTIILKNDTYVNDNLSLGLTAFYLGNDNQLQTYGNQNLFLPTPATGVAQTPLTVGGSSPFINNFGGFGYGAYLFGPPTPAPLGLFGGGYGGYFYGSGNHYNPYALYPAGSKDCPLSYVAEWGGRVNTPCGLNNQVAGSHSDTYGIQPRATIYLPQYFGIDNTIKVGALIAKETSPTGYEYVGGDANSPLDAAHQYGLQDGGTQRTIYQAYIQDKIDLIDNTLHLTPGGTVEGTYSSLVGSAVFGSHSAPTYGPNGYTSGLGTADQIDQYGPYKGKKWDREYLPFFNISYDLDKILPPLAGVTIYGSTGNSALFAPVGDFGPNTAGNPPFASIVHIYEGGVKYNVSNISLSADYFYQKVDRDFGFFSFQSGPQNGLTEYGSTGQREFKGFEAKAIYQMTPNWQLFANTSHLLAKYLQSGFALDTVAEDQYGDVAKGSGQTGIPDWLANFGVDYTKKSMFRDDDAVDVRFAGTYTGKQNTSYDLGGTDYITAPNFKGLEPLNYTPGSCGPIGAIPIESSCAYTRYNQITGATTTDPHGGISPFAVFNLDANYTLPTPYLPVLKKVIFDVNIQNLFNQRYFQYFYKQISPTNCGTIKSGPLAGAAANNYSCSPQFADGIPGQPFSVFFTVTARF
jgi:iron complex outermembrane receptor protein